MFKPCAVIPVYNHGSTLPTLIQRLTDMKLTCIVVDDGSDVQTKQVLDKLDSEFDNLERETLPNNRGKGAAIEAGFIRAEQMGFTHALQIDADGQHDVEQVPTMLKMAEHSPDALVSGKPIYDASVPRSRLYGRYITHFWVWVETLSFNIKDSMCGFRVYPIASSLEQFHRHNIGQRMTFDTDIMVRMSWAGVPVLFLPVKVIYPEDGISHFSLLRDNVRISVMHTKLVIQMLLNLPMLLLAKVFNRSYETTGSTVVLPIENSSSQDDEHWSAQQERGSYWGLLFSHWCYRHLGGVVVSLVALCAVSYFFIFVGSSRVASQQYLRRVYRQTRFDDQSVLQCLPRWRDSYWHFKCFGRSIVDRMGVLLDKMDPEDVRFDGVDELLRLASSGTGGVFFTAHLGSLEMLKTLRLDVKINVLAFSDHMRHFNRLVKKLGVKADIELIQVSSVTPATAMVLQQKIDAGEFIVIACDRTPPQSGARVARVTFMGALASFPQGAFILASLLKCPVYLLFCLNENGRHRVHFEHFAERIILPRAAREQALEAVVQQFASRLEFYCKRAPYQWFNLYDFWAE